MKENELPAGYVVLNGVTIHVAELRQHTSDVRRFMRLLPVTDKFTGLTPGSVEWKQVLWEAMADPETTIEDLKLTMREAGALYTALADEMSPGAA